MKKSRPILRKIQMDLNNGTVTCSEKKKDPVIVHEINGNESVKECITALDLWCGGVNRMNQWNGIRSKVNIFVFA